MVATPIGNLEDITLRALRVLREVSLIAAEDTRHSGRLLKHYEIATRLISFHEHSHDNQRDTIINALNEGDVALISDAGTPGVSDPGFDLVKAALAAGTQRLADSRSLRRRRGRAGLRSGTRRLPLSWLPPETIEGPPREAEPREAPRLSARHL